ncbi:MAG: NlpC/P60 family protein [Verrucomicrobia bacterium]|nr:NlpC/P60 family protein [Verrucomicrobiota bacterium]
MQTKPYKWGGGRGRLEDTGYDCSGSVSYVLIKAGLLRSPATSGAFASYGVPGPGRWITIYARNGHVFMTLCGLRLDTSGHAERGPRWCANFRSASGYVMRHPAGY